MSAFRAGETAIQSDGGGPEWKPAIASGQQWHIRLGGFTRPAAHRSASSGPLSAPGVGWRNVSAADMISRRRMEAQMPAPRAYCVIALLALDGCGYNQPGA
jgi:hypothetical protein